MEYINNKVQAYSFKLKAFDADDKQNYNLSLKCVDIKIENDKAYLSINTDISFNYKGADSKSEYGEQNWIVISTTNSGNKEIIDWYIPFKDYDVSVRGSIDSIYNLNVWGTSKGKEILKKQQSENNTIQKYYSELSKKQNSSQLSSANIEKDNIKSTSSLTLHSLNKSNIVTWATNNYNKVNPTSGNSAQVSSYYDIATIPGNYDCTNFVSHAVLAGGTPVYDTGGYGISGTGWYFRNIYNRSSSWTGVVYLYNYIKNNTNKGPTATELSYSNVYPPTGYYPYVFGDLMQFYGSTEWIHSAVITSYIPVSGSSTTLEAGITFRVSSSTYALNMRQSDEYSGHSRRVLKLNGYYS